MAFNRFSKYIMNNGCLTYAYSICEIVLHLPIYMVNKWDIM